MRGGEPPAGRGHAAYVGRAERALPLTQSASPGLASHHCSIRYKPLQQLCRCYQCFLESYSINPTRTTRIVFHFKMFTFLPVKIRRIGRFWGPMSHWENNHCTQEEEEA